MVLVRDRSCARASPRPARSEPPPGQSGGRAFPAGGEGTPTGWRLSYIFAPGASMRHNPHPILGATRNDMDPEMKRPPAGRGGLRFRNGVHARRTTLGRAIPSQYAMCQKLSWLTPGIFRLTCSRTRSADRALRATPRRVSAPRRVFQHPFQFLLRCQADAPPRADAFASSTSRQPLRTRRARRQPNLLRMSFSQTIYKAATPTLQISGARWTPTH
jgi:hypothetical protein